MTNGTGEMQHPDTIKMEDTGALDDAAHLKIDEGLLMDKMGDTK